MLKTVKKPSQKSSATQSKFTEKWLHIEKKQQRNKNLEKKIATGSKAIMENKKRQYLEVLLENQASLRHTLTTATRMKLLNKTLSDRYARHYANPFVNFGSLQALFDNDFDIFSGSHF